MNIVIDKYNTAIACKSVANQVKDFLMNNDETVAKTLSGFSVFDNNIFNKYMFHHIEYAEIRVSGIDERITIKADCIARTLEKVVIYCASFDLCKLKYDKPFGKGNMIIGNVYNLNEIYFDKTI